MIPGEFEIDPDPTCEHALDTMTKRYVAETYAQSAIEGVIELAEREDIDPEEVSTIRLDTFGGAKLIIGGGKGSRYEIETKEQADRSLPYMLAAALIDREMTNAAYEADRIRRDDVQRLLERVDVEEDPELTEQFEAGEMPAVIDVTIDDGTTYRVEKDDFAGHPRNAMSWTDVEEKFETMTREHYDAAHREETVEVVRGLKDHDAADLIDLLD